MTRINSLHFANFIFLLCLGLAGCANSTDPVALYLLDASPAALTTTNDTLATTSALVVDPVSVAPYLDNGGVVYQVNAHRIVIARNNQWAAPLSDQLTDSLYTTLASDVPKMYVLNAGAHVPDGAYRLTTHVDRFQGLYRGVAEIAGTWQLFNRNKECIARQPFEMKVPLRSDGYPELVRSLSRGWRKISEGMATTISGTLRARSVASHESHNHHRGSGWSGFPATL